MPEVFSINKTIIQINKEIRSKIMRETLKKMISYYKPYKGVFFTDMFFAIMASAVALVIPLVVRYVTSTVIYMDRDKAMKTLVIIAVVVTLLILFQCYCNYYISNYGHVMGCLLYTSDAADD